MGWLRSRTMARLPQDVFDFLIADRCLMCRREYPGGQIAPGVEKLFTGRITQANPIRLFHLVRLVNHPVCGNCGREFETAASPAVLAEIADAAVVLADGTRFEFDPSGREKAEPDASAAKVSGTIPIIAPFKINDAALQLVHLLKFSGYRSLARPMAGAMNAALERFSAGAAGPDLLAPVPMGRSRRRERGFNQAELIGRELADQMNLCQDGRALRRVRAGRQQSKTGRLDRAANVRGAFLADRDRVSGRRVDLVDDLVTSGATAAACAAALLASGAARVRVLSFGRAV